MICSQKLGGGYEGKPSIFDGFNRDDLIIAFFPCTRFENQINITLRGQSHGQEEWSDKRKMENCMRIQTEVVENYQLINMLFIICDNKGLRLIFENPYSEEHYLRRYWCIQPSIIDKDRTERGDYFVKPTQYWFYNCKPENNFILEPQNLNFIGVKDANRQLTKKDCEKMGATKIKTARSMIHPDYANRFIREFIL